MGPLTILPNCPAVYVYVMQDEITLLNNQHDAGEQQGLVQPYHPLSLATTTCSSKLSAR